MTDKLKISQWKQENRVITLCCAILFVWWSGLGGSELYGIPSLFLLFYLLYLGQQGKFSTVCQGAVLKMQNFFIHLNPKWLKILFIIHSCLWAGVVILRYYSFNLWTFDAGLHSNIIYNMSQGEFFSSYLYVNNLGDHFTPILVFISLLYKIVPTIHWMMLSKVTAYLFAGVLLYRACLKGEGGFPKNKLAAIWLAGLWFLFYAPIVNSVRYEFQASSLAPPLIIIAFLSMQKKKWWAFAFTMVLLLGVKEHLGAVWIGFGAYKLLQSKSDRKLGIFLILGGILSIYLVMYQVMPFFRDGRAAWSGGERIGPFVDIPPKILYFIKLLIPFLFIPLIFWKNGIMAMPAIGINLISKLATMYSSHYHYDDVAATLLFIATAISIPHCNFKKIKQALFVSQKKQWALLVLFFFSIGLLPYSNLRFLKKAIPTNVDWQINQELEAFDRSTKGSYIAVQDVLGAHFNRKKIELIIHRKGKNCVDSFRHSLNRNPISVEYYVLAPAVSHYQIADMQQCLRDFSERKDMQRLDNYNHLVIFKQS